MDVLRRAARELPPAYFALVMATGINSIAMFRAHHATVSALLLAVAALALLILTVLTVWRAVAYRDRLLADLTNPRRMFGAFTLVAGFDVVAARSALGGRPQLAVVLLGVGILAWLTLSYSMPAIILVRRSEGPVLGDVDGTWFIAVVATQSVALGACALEPWWPHGARWIALLAVMLWSLGVVLYLSMATVLLVRLLLVEIGPDTITPPYWIVMGATSITVFAGARLLEFPVTPILAASRSVLSGLSVVLWAFGTWLIPLLAGFGVWRHVILKVPLRYEPALWSICFPLGMYAVASGELGRTAHLPLVGDIGHVWAWVALSAWVVVFVAMLASLLRAARRPVEVAAGVSTAPRVQAGAGQGRRKNRRTRVPGASPTDTSSASPQATHSPRPPSGSLPGTR